MTVIDVEVEAPESSKPKRRSRISGKALYITGTVALLGYLVAGPLGVLLFSSFKRTEGTLPFESESPYTLENYSDVFLTSSTYSTLWNTAMYAAGALTLSFTIAITLAWLVRW